MNDHPFAPVIGIRNGLILALFLWALIGLGCWLTWTVILN